MRFLRLWIRGLLYPDVSRYVVWKKSSGVSEETAASIFKLE